MLIRGKVVVSISVISSLVFVHITMCNNNVFALLLHRHRYQLAFGCNWFPVAPTNRCCAFQV